MGKDIAQKNKGGRPTKYTHLDLKKVKALAERGWTDREMSEFFDVCYATWNNWKGAHPKFLDSLKGWKTHADSRVERALYERAIGYEHHEDKIFNDGGEPLVVPTIKHYPPDTTAALGWLHNRMPEDWRQKREIELTGAGGGALVIHTNAVVEDADSD